ncbi:MAG TPA: ATP-binding protein [Chthoniobacteraceae bacterium]|jgi:signal transduction histidine kinase|nr:ATP-binding protein [Chthoniobacteraceae bacterium]
MNILSRRWQPWLLSILLSILAAAGAGALFLGGDTGQPYMPHAHCYFMNESLIRLHGYSDFLIGAAYVAISGTLAYLVMRARREIPFHWMMLAFALFIIACGATHFMEVRTLRSEHPAYWFAGKLKALTAAASVVTAVMLPPLVPKILVLLSDSRLSAQRKRELEQAHEELGRAHVRVKQLDQLKTNFFANVSHELRTPITLILGPVNNLLGARGLTMQQRRELEVVKRNATLLHKQVNDLLDIARLEAGKMQLRYTRFDLSRLARLVSSFFSSGTLRTIELTVEAPGETMIEADSEKIQAMLFNLVSNAYKFTPEHGKVRMIVSEEGETVLVRVEDTGPGITPEKRQWIFERFTQAETPTARGGSGTGLGLSIVRDFVQLHHGEIWIAEAPGGGASFQIRLPRHAPAGMAVADETVQQRGDAAASFSAGKETARATLSRIDPVRAEPEGKTAEPYAPLVLVVEDHPEMRDHIVSALSAEWRVATAANGRIALEMAPSARPDLIVTDLMMPEMTGDELLAKLQADPALAGIPVILLTARADEEMKLRLLREGAQDYLVKPFAAEELQARVRNLISTKVVRDLLQGELSSREENVERLAKEVTLRARELERAKESAEAANRAKDQFLAVLSHELRTPLTPALATAMNLELQENLEPDELRRSLQVIRRNIELEARLIDDLLDLTRIARGKLLLDMEEVDAHDAIRHAVEMVNSELAGKGSNLVLDLRAERHSLKADAARLLQVVWNLLLNAVKFTPAEGRIDLRTFNEGDRFVMELTDTGVGISPELLRKIFEPFEQADQLAARRFGGLGLGLAVAKGLVEAHGGTIGAQSEGVGRGATFRIVFDLMESPSPEGSLVAGHSPVPQRPAALRLLLVEDHDDTREAMERLLRLWGHQVTAVRTVKDALTEVERAEFNLLVSDLGLPDGHGTEIMDAVRTKSPGVVGIAMSGFGMEEDLDRSREAGFSEHLTKPVATLRLKALLEQYGGERSSS